MGRLLLVVALASCTHATTSSPAWPKSAASDKDGGESLAPHEAKSIAVAVEKPVVEAKPDAKPEVKPAVVAPTEAGGAAVVAPAVTQPGDETMTTEEIIIEIDE